MTDICCSYDETDVAARLSYHIIHGTTQVDTHPFLPPDI